LKALIIATLETSVTPHDGLIGIAAIKCARVRSIRGEDILMADSDLKAELERLKAENERLKNQRGRGVSLKVSEKGGVSVYGLGRFPVTL
jgi:hypothetical protein